MSLFYEMDLAVHDEIGRAELATIDPVLYVHLLEVCARVAANILPCGEHGHGQHLSLHPPATQHIRADLVIPDDFVLRDDMSFDCVEATTRDGNEVVIVCRGGRTTIYTARQPVRVAVDPTKAIRWNEERAFMGPLAVQLFAAQPQHRRGEAC